MYLKTKFAWYILDAPSRSYHTFFINFWLKHRVLHQLVTSVLVNPTITLPKFLQSLATKDDTSVIFKALGRPLSEDDVLSKDTVRQPFIYMTYTLTSL
jgi:DNA (cytosine-5)-methyltransferase 1